MKIDDLDFDLPKELIAQEPVKDRSSSRLLCVDRESKSIYDDVFSSIVDRIPSGDVLVVNDTKVSRARVMATKEATGGKVELLFLGQSTGETDRVLIQPALKEGQKFIFDAQAKISGEYVGRDSDGIALVKLEGASADEIMNRYGQIPLPPYIKRLPNQADDSQYQTVYASTQGAVAAPTAGLHFAPGLIRALENKGVCFARLTLHVGYGTFKTVQDIESHRMHEETFFLPQQTVDSIHQAKSGGGRVWAVGTTVLRTLETCVVNKKLVSGEGSTDLYIHPPFEFEIVDRLITNFHLPRTSLLLLVSAFMSEQLRKKAYAHAVTNQYRFFSYGDAMLIA